MSHQITEHCYIMNFWDALIPCQIQGEGGKLRLPGVDGPYLTFLKN